MAEFQHNNYVHTTIQQSLFLLNTRRLPCMGFEPWQNPSSLEIVNEFMERMRIAIDKAKSAIRKAQNNMKRYYDQCRTPAPVFNPGDKVFLNASDIWTMCPSQKLLHRWLGPFVIERRIGPMVYCLKLLHQMKQLHPVFNIVKLTLTLDNPITEQKMEDHPPPIIIDGEAEWEVEEILDSCWHQRRFQYLIKWKGYGCEHNSWESTSKVSVPELTTKFHCKHPGALRHIRHVEFDNIFHPESIAPRHSNLEEGVNIRGHLHFYS